MRSKRSLMIFYLLLITTILSVIGITNSKKTYIKIFIWNTNEMTLGKLINISFFTGFTISTIAALNISKAQSSIQDQFEVKQTETEDETTQEYPERERSDTFKERPPERDINSTQPTVSVSYRVVDQSQQSDSNDFQIDNENNNDWTNYDNEW